MQEKEYWPPLLVWILSSPTTWALTICKWVYNPYKYGYNPTYPVVRPFIGVITLLITIVGAHLVWVVVCCLFGCFLLCFLVDRSLATPRPISMKSPSPKYLLLDMPDFSVYDYTLEINLAHGWKMDVVSRCISFIWMSFRSANISLREGNSLNSTICWDQSPCSECVLRWTCEAQREKGDGWRMDFYGLKSWFGWFSWESDFTVSVYWATF